MKIYRLKDPFFSVVSGSLYDLPSPSSLSYLWNFGSLLGMFFFVQILTGLFLSMHYVSAFELAFDSVVHLVRDVGSGYLFRFCHMNGASFFFIFIFLHVGRGLYFGSYKLKLVWLSGGMILFLLMGIAFLGYVLPWGQMSFWGATVITNLVSAVPYLGSFLVEWLWGGYSVGGATLTRFFSLHFLFPFVLGFLVILHLFYLHMPGSSNSTLLVSDMDKLTFYSYFGAKDVLGGFGALFLFFLLVFFFPFVLGDPENYNMANPMSTPAHIQPEWYFLFAYAILRSIPSKLGGVIFLVLSILIFALHSFLLGEFSAAKGYFLKKFNIWMLYGLFFMLTYIGAKPVEYPYEGLGRIVGVLYFFFALTLLL